MSRLRWVPYAAVVLIALLAVSLPILPLPDPLKMDVAHRLAGPSIGHPLGLDAYGRDELTRLLWGGRVSLSVAVASSALACVVGVVLGLLGGFLNGFVEFLTIRSMDVVLCFPPLLLALLVVTLLGPGAATLIPVLALLFLPGFARVVYSGVLSVRSQEYVEAMRALGVGPLPIMLRTVLPNVSGPVLVQFSLAAASAVVLESGLSFLGLGVVPPSASWGLMIGDARGTMAQAPLLLLWPCLALTLTILALNAFCDALRDALDPHARTVMVRRRRRLDALLPGLGPAPSLVLEVRDLTLEIGLPGGPVRAVRGVSLGVQPGETLAIVGESGSGKSLTGLAIMGLLPGPVRAAGGAVFLEGRDLLRLEEGALRRLRGGRLAMVFQDPLSGLNPVHRVGAQIAEALHAHQSLSAAAARREAIDLLRRVGMPDPERQTSTFPHELSGGMRQRAMIAMAIANDPTLLIADEPTTALDVTVQAQVLDLLADLRRERGMSMVLITHSLPVVSEIADRVMVMYAGQVVEEGKASEVFAAPLHPYTAALLASAPAENGDLPEAIPGAVPPPHALPPGCAFAPRCSRREAFCETTVPPLFEPRPGRRTRCLRWQELSQ
jgi:peptide/nickel transport system permease protein